MLEAIDLLPVILREKSLSDQEIVLPYQDALDALNILLASNWALLGWEGWVKYPNGQHGHPPKQIIGTESIDQKIGETWEDYVQRSSHFCRETIDAEQKIWDTNLLNVSLELYFCINASSP